MEKDLIIESSSDGSFIALLEDKNLVEFHHEKISDDFLVGNIYLGKVKKLLPALNAAFIDIGHEKDAFLHYLDLGANFPTFNDFTQKAIRRTLTKSSLERFNFLPELDKGGKIKDVLKPNQQIVVQLVKEPISTKGPRLSSEITLAGRFLILIPFKDNISISKKITNKSERARLKDVVSAIKPKNFGVIVRTLAEGKTVETLQEDFELLVKRWEELFYNLNKKKPKLVGEVDRASSLLRDILNDSFNEIKVDNKQAHDQLREFIGQIAPKKVNIVKQYRGKTRLFEYLGINKQIKSLFGKTVNIGGGAYLVIEHTEAMHVIDVNSGSKRIKGMSQEENALKTNLEAAREVSRQLRLRDMGGIIVVDFIDMKAPSNRKQVYNHIKNLMNEDRAKHSILSISKFGLMQITRQRVRPEISIESNEVCPVCRGTGEVTPTIILVDEIENQMNGLLEDSSVNHVKLIVHPYLHAYITKGFWSLKMKWMLKFKKWITVQALESSNITSYQILNAKGEDLRNL